MIREKQEIVKANYSFLINQLRLVTPVSLAFLVMPISFYFQVIFMEPRIAMIPYMLIILGFITKIKILRQFNHDFYNNFDILDWIIITYLIMNLGYLFYGGLITGWPLSLVGKYFLQYIIPVFLYFYFSRFYNIQENKIIFLFMIIMFGIVTVQWLIETYYLRVLRIVPDFQVMSGLYSSMRNMNATIQVASIDNRAFGLIQNHTGTGAFIIISGLSLINFKWFFDKRKLSGLLFIVLLIVGIGNAKTAFFIFLLTIILSFFSINIKLRDLKIPFLIVGLIIFLFTIGVFFSDSMYKLFINWRKDFRHLLDIFNLSHSLDNISWIQIYKNVFIYLVDYFRNHKPVIFLGEGIISVNTPGFARGGDVALFEVASMFGVLFLLMFLFTFCIIFWHLTLQIRNYFLADKLDDCRVYETLYSYIVVIFLLGTLGHYNTLFMKEIYLIFFLALGLIRSHKLYTEKLPHRRVIS